jgi:hypothetical protein
VGLDKLGFIEAQALAWEFRPDKKSPVGAGDVVCITGCGAINCQPPMSRLRDEFRILGLSSLAFSDALTGLIAFILIYPG